MNLRRRTVVFSFTLLSILAACQGKKEKNTEMNHDTIPPELNTLNEQLKSKPNDTEIYHKRAIWFINHSRFEEALKDLRIAITRDSLNPAYFVTLGDTYLNMGQPILAEDSYLKALKRQPDYNDALVGMARYYLVLKNHDQTLALTAKAIMNQKFNPKAYYLAAWSFMEKGDTLSALKNYLKAIEQNQDYFDAYVQLGILYSRKQPQMAIGYFKNALQLNPRHLHTRYLLGLTYEEIGEIEKAITAHQDNLAIDAQYVPSLFAMGYILMSDKLDFREAIKWFDQVISLDKKNAPAYLNRGYCHEAMGEIKEALADYRKALELDPSLNKAAEGIARITR